MASNTAEIAPEHHVERGERVTPLELFFDLVFVFAITQVTTLMSEDPTWRGLGQGVLVLAALWWAWGAYAWLTSGAWVDEGSARVLMLVSMAAMLVAALAVPTAFGEDGVLFGFAYFIVRFTHIFLFAETSPDVDARQAVSRLARTAIPGPAVLIAAGFLDGTPQAALWVAALAFDYSGPYLFGVRGFRLSASHFAERFGLIVIIALGESIVAIGVGAAGVDLGVEVVVAAVLGIAVVAALWWAYFDVVALVAERRLLAARGYEQLRMARDSYSYLHLPMIAGIVLLALGIKKTISGFDDPLGTVPAVALCGGVSLYLAGHIAFRLRNVRSLNKPRLVTAVASLGLIPLATAVDALYALAAVAALCSLLIAYEAVVYAEARARVRAAA
jgi:low temperature requirement protein LtrA